MLHVKTVLEEPTLGQMNEALDRLPQSLGAAFDKTMQRIEDQPHHRRQLAYHCLMWVSYARRPLMFGEISDALAITTKPNLTSVDEAYKTYRPDQRKLTDCCHGLIVVDEKSMVVRLAHYSIHEYLCCSDPPILFEAERRVAELCLKYQMMEPFAAGCCNEEEEMIDILEECPFIIYAARNWVCLDFLNRLVTAGGVW